MSCTNCGSPFHEIWDCKKPLRKGEQARQVDTEVNRSVAPAKVAQATIAESRTGDTREAEATIASPPLAPKDTRKADRHPPGYQAAKQKLYRERKKAKAK